eukprot:4709431-Amphidinium_carterae.3
MKHQAYANLGSGMFTTSGTGGYISLSHVVEPPQTPSGSIDASWWSEMPPRCSQMKIPDLVQKMPAR